MGKELNVEGMIQHVGLTLAHNGICFGKQGIYWVDHQVDLSLEIELACQNQTLT
jgi:hypothetical protein